MRSETLDFVQLNYSLDDRAAERKLLPLAADRGISILVNLPFGGGGLLRRLDDQFHETGSHGTGGLFVDSSFVVV